MPCVIQPFQINVPLAHFLQKLCFVDLIVAALVDYWAKEAFGVWVGDVEVEINVGPGMKDIIKQRLDPSGLMHLVGCISYVLLIGTVTGFYQ